jgi:outer membrane protein TolC
MTTFRVRLRPLRPWWLGAPFAFAVAWTLTAHPARALQPVGEFLTHAKTWNTQNRAAHATTAQRDAELGISTGALLPNLSATAMYTRNQYQVTTGDAFSGLIPPNTPTLIIQPQDQFDGNAILNIPIIHIANWDRRAAAKSALAGARADEANSELLVQKDVLKGYYSLLGDEAVLLSATKNAAIARHNVKLASDRKEGGTGSELDVQRALADQAKADQSVTAAQLSVTNARRDLYSLSGLVAEPAAGFPEDDLREEPALESWMGQASAAPAVKSARANRITAEESARAVKHEVLPTLAATAEEKLTNATAFNGGHGSVYLLQLAATWRLDTTISAQNRAQNAAAAVARANEDQARIAAEDAVFKDWQQIRADIDSARSARAQVKATQLAASLAEDRYESGVATQLDVLQAQQDAFSADVARIQADADLAYARLALRLDAGQLVKETR